jgi:hypothetical protein
MQQPAALGLCALADRAVLVHHGALFMRAVTERLRASAIFGRAIDFARQSARGCFAILSDFCWGVGASIARRMNLSPVRPLLLDNCYSIFGHRARYFGI